MKSVQELLPQKEKNLLLDCSLFPGRHRKQLFQVRKRNAAMWEQEQQTAF